MPVAASDLISYGCANHAEDDTSTQGGAIDLTVKVAMTFMAADNTIEALSANAGDTTQTLTVTGRLASGVIDTETIALNGTNVVTAASPKTWDRILKVVMSATAAGTVTVRVVSAGATIATLEAGFTSVRTLYYDATSQSGAISVYEKLFFKNTHATLALTSAALKLTLEPAGVSDYLMAVEDAVDDSNTSTNRLTAPTGQSAFRQLDVSEGVPGGSLGAGVAIGCWLQMNLAADNAAVIDDWSVELSGATV